MHEDSPTPDAIPRAVAEAHAALLLMDVGKNADYIPFLAAVPTSLAAVSTVPPDGAMREEGDSRHALALESVSKVATLALVMEGIGPFGVKAKVGVSPTSLPFNSLVAPELHSGKPLSPLVNAGTIATASLVPGETPDAR